MINNSLQSEEARAEYMNRLGNALMQLSVVFAEQGITLTSVVLGSAEDGLRYRASIDRYHSLLINVGMDPETGQPTINANVAGIEIRWPAVREALRSGGFIFK